MKPHNLAALLSSPWLVEPAAHAIFVASALEEVGSISRLEPAARVNADEKVQEMPKLQVENGLATLRVSGVMMRRPDAYDMRNGAAPTEHLTGLAREAMARPDVKAVLIHFDSPGGQVSGTAEFADAVRDLSSKKRTVAYTDGLLASAAYWVASQAGIIVASPSATIGSIGVYAAILDMKGLFDKFGIKMEVLRNKAGDLKTAGLPGTSLTDEQRAHLEGRMEEIFAEFAGAVNAMRPGVDAGSMRGQTFFAKPALAAALVDQVGNLADARRIVGY